MKFLQKIGKEAFFDQDSLRKFAQEAFFNQISYRNLQKGLFSKNSFRKHCKGPHHTNHKT